MRTYKLRRFNMNGREYFTLCVPPDFATELPQDIRFSCELTEEGILYRPVVPAEEPSWLTELRVADVIEPHHSGRLQ